jgi:hypothetical protein
MQVVLFDLTNRNTLEQLSQKLRLTNQEVHDVFANVNELPNGAYGIIDQTWYVSQVIAKLADMFSANLFSNNTEFILDTELTILNISVTMLALETQLNCKITNYRDLL